MSRHFCGCFDDGSSSSTGLCRLKIKLMSTNHLLRYWQIGRRHVAWQPWCRSILPHLLATLLASKLTVTDRLLCASVSLCSAALLSHVFSCEIVAR